jgi:DNA (cytosine-5)-methyltransferase 1
MADTFIDLFSGCGGLSLGLRRAGWKSLFAVEAHRHAFETYKANHLTSKQLESWPSWLPVGPMKIEELLLTHRQDLEKLSGKVTLVAGGPPCQGFSTAGRRKAGDPRNMMVHHYLELLSIVRPDFVLMENVRGFTTMQHEEGSTYSDYVSDELRDLGYDVWSELLVATAWGVPQNRPRFFIVAARRGSLKGIDPFLRLKVARKAFLEERNLPLERPVTAQEAIGDLEIEGRNLIECPDGGVSGFKQIEYLKEPKGLSAYAKLMRSAFVGAPTGLRLPRHSAKTSARFAEIISNCEAGKPLSLTDRERLGMKKRSLTPLSATMPSCTVTTLPDDIVHYREARILTVRECARLQSFPDSFDIKGPYTTGGPQRAGACPRYTQVGNAVPPLLAEALGEMLLGLRLSAEQLFDDGRQVLEMT